MNRRRLAAVAAGLLMVASISAAQLPQLRGGQRASGRVGGGIKWARFDDFDGSFVFCRLYFDTHQWGDGGNWSVDYPRADINLTFRLSELTTTSVSRHPTQEFNHVVVRATDPLIYRCPFVMMTEPGRLDFSAAETAGLRDYLLKGGFLWVDDFWGPIAWENFAEQMAAVLPPSQYPIRDLPLSHPVFRALYEVRRIAQIPNIGFFLGTGGTSEEGIDSAEPHVRAISDDHDNVMVLMTHNTDFGDAFEREGFDHRYFLAFAAEGYAFGINALVYAMSH